MKKVIHKKLNELKATAICGNDISSSCLYVSALAIMYAGQFAWISLLVVALVLYLFRKIYGDKSIDARITFSHREKGLAVIAFHTDNQIEFSVSFNRARIKHGIYSRSVP